MSDSASTAEEQFVVRGRYQARDGWQEFEKRVDAPNQSVAVERTYAEVGSQHALKRTQIDVYGVSA
ncbi:MAG: 50S ribosomal protein L18Ae [Haloarculaceae archaeon]